MSPDPKLPRTEDGKVIAPCHRCGTNILTSGAIHQVDDDGNIISSFAFDICSDCKADIKRRVAAQNAERERQDAINEQKIAALLSHRPKQMGLNMGSD